MFSNLHDYCSNSLKNTSWAYPTYFGEDDPFRVSTKINLGEEKGKERKVRERRRNQERMNRGVFQSAVAQEIMAGNPNWWNMNALRSSTTQQSSPFLSSSNPNLFVQFPPSSSSTSLPVPSWLDVHEFPESWSHLLFGGLAGDEKSGVISQFQGKKLENWEDQLFSSQIQKSAPVDIKQENSASSYMHGHGVEDFDTAKQAWPLMVPASSPQSCVSSFSSNVLDFSKNKTDGRHPPPDRSSECNSTATGGAIKKARVQPSSSQTTFKVRKEKLGDRVSTLHQLVSPFGKTDTASVLLEAIGYIRFLQSQVEALSLPYLNSASANLRQQHSVHGESCIFPEDPGQLVNENCMKRKIISGQDSDEEPKDLRSKGLCLVPVSCTVRVVSDNGADYWAPAFNGGFR